ncbi:hypothetical protein DFJ58DRAFT_909816 [Suillus subalutaceus]|uniref:uncharacterized protein n=1 Tax=Suillus subalutaceus TaxID=48586 RepID=UPI001B879308|nr:uncharacterized protein DFJ58DRAFT_909816 [Suillus subalutaceus]KAG1876568.1 hypothetical protein DFJ58DRAFT_909816 [Suillus subalutaceus]
MSGPFAWQVAIDWHKSPEQQRPTAVGFLAYQKTLLRSTRQAFVNFGPFSLILHFIENILLRDLENVFGTGAHSPDCYCQLIIPSRRPELSTKVYLYCNTYNYALDVVVVSPERPSELQLVNMSTPPSSRTEKGPSGVVPSLGRVVRLPSETFLCMWDGDAPGIHCNELFCGYELPAHLRDHGIRGADKLRFSCQWESCGTKLNRESIVRHVKEKHLRINSACDICNQTFTREYNLAAHCKKSHPGKQ